MLLVRGFPDDHRVWRNQVPALVDVGHRVIALDTRGCGESEIKPRESDYAIEKLVADLVALLAYNQGLRFLLLFQKPGPGVAQQGLIIRRRSDTVMRRLTRQKRTLFKVICVGYY